MSKKPNPSLNNTQIKTLLCTPEHFWVDMFPKHSRRFLREERAKHLADPQIQLDKDKVSHKLGHDITQLRRKYKLLLKEYETLENSYNDVLKVKQDITPLKIKPSKGTSKLPGGTAVVLASDWHCEEIVDPKAVEFVNEYNPAIFEERIENLTRQVIRQVTKERVTHRIDDLIIWLGGDLLTGHIHEELAEITAMPPAEATLMLNAAIQGMVEYILSELDIGVHLVCSVGNHSRTTKERRISTELGHSWEYVLYHFLADAFDGHADVTVTPPEGYHTYVDINGYTIRFHHGHNIVFRGGSLAFGNSALKRIQHWNRAKKADLDCFGHWHWLCDHNSFVSNGSLIGYNGYGLAIGAEIQRPGQAFFIVDHQYGKTTYTPIYV